MNGHTYPKVSALNSTVGIGLRAPHYLDVINTKPKIDWFEVHSENYFGSGGKAFYYLDQISLSYPISFHGVGLSLGTVGNLSFPHLNKLQTLINRYEPVFVSEHLSWSAAQGHYINDLLPLPYTEEALRLIVNHINQTQDYLNHQLLIENISCYMQFTHSIMPEYEFINEVIHQTGCGLLLDINNLYINSINHGWNATIYLEHLTASALQEIHLAGYTENKVDGGSILIDTHNKPVTDAVWNLYKTSMQLFGPIATLIEWDKDIPHLDILMQEATKARRLMEPVDALTN